METLSNPRHKDNVIVKLSFQFALSIIRFVEGLEANRKFVIAKQLIRSGTSIGANIKEAQNAESKKDFIHKLKIAMKEVEETEYWLLICQESQSYPNTEKEINELISVRKVLSKIIKSSLMNTPNRIIV